MSGEKQKGRKKSEYPIHCGFTSRNHLAGAQSKCGCRSITDPECQIFEKEAASVVIIGGSFGKAEEAIHIP